MSNADETRWRQRLGNFGKALAELQEACDKENYSRLERAGLIKTFEFTFELLWKTLKDLLFYEGYDLPSPRAVIRTSFEMEYISENDCEILLGALGKRNLLSHTYHEKAALEAEHLVKAVYHPLLRRVYQVLEKKKNI